MEELIKLGLYLLGGVIGYFLLKLITLILKKVDSNYDKPSHILVRCSTLIIVGVYLMFAF